MVSHQGRQRPRERDRQAVRRGLASVVPVEADEQVGEEVDVGVAVFRHAFGHVVTLAGRRAGCACPKCGVASRRVHGRYERRVQDLPIRAGPENALRRFIVNLDTDRDAVHNALTQPQSNGTAEGQVNRLMLLKRSSYCCASFDLLRKQVLHQLG